MIGNGAQEHDNAGGREHDYPAGTVVAFRLGISRALFCLESNQSALTLFLFFHQALSIDCGLSYTCPGKSQTSYAQAILDLHNASKMLSCQP